MEQAITVLETRLRDSREFCCYFDKWFTVSVSIRAWDGTLVHGEWRYGKWISRWAKAGVVDRDLRAAPIVVRPVMRAGRRRRM